MRTLVPKFSLVKVNLGKWRVDRDEVDPLKRMPKGEVLLKARFWSEPSMRQIQPDL